MPRAEIIVTVGSFAAAAAALALAGAMTAFIGQRLRATLPGIVATALLVAPPFGADRDPAPGGDLPRAAAARAARARADRRRRGRRGRARGLRRSLSLCAAGGYRRSLVPCAITASFAAILFLAFGIALSPLGGRARVIAR